MFEPVATNLTAVGFQPYVILVREEVYPPEKVRDTSSQSSARVVRRPIGVEFKSNTFAFIEVLRTASDAAGSVTLTPMNIFNESEAGTIGGSSTSGMATYTNNFLITDIQEPREEKFQLLETFGQDFIFFFGQRPRIATFAGILINSRSHQWRKEWWLNYDQFLRGTKLVENKARLFLSVDDRRLGGYLLSCTATETAAEPRLVRFQFQMLVTDDADTTAGTDEAEHKFAADYLRKIQALNQGPQLPGGGLGGTLDAIASTAGSAIGAITSFVQDPVTQAIAQAAASFERMAASGGLNITDFYGSAISSAINTATLLESVDIAVDNPDLAQFRGVGGIVEFRGKPLELTSIGGTTIQQAGIDKILAVYDNSLSILLSFSRNPAIKFLEGLLGPILDTVFRATGWEFQFDNLRSATPSRSGVLIPVAGVDFFVPAPVNFFEINPVTPDDTAHTVHELPLPTGSTIDFDRLKKDPQYKFLPRAWRIRIEKDPDSMSAKLLLGARLNDDNDLVARIEISRRVVFQEAELTRKVRGLLGN